MRKTKIICTIGPSSNHPHIIAKLIKSGMNIARLNMAHVYNYKKLNQDIKTIREEASKAGKFVGQQSVQLHGGMGVTDELIVYLWIWLVLKFV